MSIRAIVSACISVWIAAVPAFSQALSKQQQIESHNRQAQEYLKKNQPDLAAKEFTAILELDPNNLDARGNLGVMYYFHGDYAKAAPQLRAVIKLQPNLSKIQALLGMTERRLGQTAAALSDLDQSFPQIQDQKLRIQVGMELIEIHYGASNLHKAANVVGVLKQLAPTDPDILYTAYGIYSDLAGESMLSIAMLAPKRL
jgi:tetratricopeptide (TPR) repeat protein